MYKRTASAPRRPLLRAVIALALIVAAAGAWGLSTFDPNDEIYTWLSLWDQKGYFPHLPMLRPYAPQLIKSCLESVITNGSDIERAMAEAYLSELTGQEKLLSVSPTDGVRVTVGAAATAEGFLTTSPLDSLIRPGLEVSASGGFGPLVQFSGMTGAWAYNKPESAFIPYHTAPLYNYQAASAASATIGGTAFSLPTLWRGGIFLGTESLSFQAGLMQTSFGPFLETSSIIGAQAPDAGHFSFTYRSSWLTLSSVLLELSATTMANPADPVGTTTLVSPAGVVAYVPTKYLILHSMGFDPLPWLTVGVIQSTVFGGRLDLLYLIPFGILADSQSYSGDLDNSLMGFYGRVRLPLNLLFDFTLYVDDFNMNEALKLNFNSDQNKLALQAGLSWTPGISMPLSLAVEYLMITPYMYTHSRFAAVPYTNYTTFGSSLGSVLDPNSDQLVFRAKAKPLDWLSGELWLRLVRHGNGSDHGAGSVAGDGSVWDDGYTGGAPGTVTFFTPSTFLTQAVLEKTFQTGIAADVRLPFGPVSTWLRAEYTFEYVWNKGLVEGANGANNYLKLTVKAGL